MSYFDGIIPNACRGCFAWDGQKWVQIDEGLCDACEYMLDMFPILDVDKAKERDNLAAGMEHFTKNTVTISSPCFPILSCTAGKTAI